MKPTKENPMIEERPSETIERATNGLRWLTAVHAVEGDAFGGEPNGAIKTARYFLYQCCLDALDFAKHQVEEIERTSKAAT